MHTFDEENDDELINSINRIEVMYSNSISM